MNWRMVYLGERDAYEAISYFEAFKISMERGLNPNTLYLYGFSEPTVFFGKGRAVNTVKLDSCRRQGIKTVRGGIGGENALYFDRSATYLGILLYRTAEETPADIEMTRCQRGLINALSLLGLKAEPKKDGNDVLVDGKKICTIATHAYKSIQMNIFGVSADFNFEMADKVIVPKSDMRKSITTLKEKLGHVVSPEAIIMALKAGFEPVFKTEFEVSYELNEAEKKIVAELRKKYTSEEWTRRGKWSPIKDYWRPK